MECVDDVLNLLVVDRLEVADAGRKADAVRGEVGDFKAVESFDQVLSDGDDSAVLDDDDWGRGGDFVRSAERVRHEVGAGDNLDVAHGDVAFRNGAAVEPSSGRCVCHDVRGAGHHDGVRPVEALVDFTEERGLTCRVLSGFRFAVRNADNVFDAEREGIESGRSDEEVIARDLSGDSEVSGEDETLAIEAGGELDDAVAQFALVRRCIILNEGFPFCGIADALRLERRLHSGGLDLDAGDEVESFETFEGLFDGFPADDGAVVFHHDAVGPLRKFGGDDFSERFASGNIILGEGDFSADFSGAGDEIGIGAPSDEAECDECGRVCMEHALGVRTEGVNGLVEGKFDAGAVFADDGSVGFDHHDIVGTEGSFVDPAGGDPDISFIVFDGDVSAGGGGHSIIIESLEVCDEQVSRMNIVAGHVSLLFS